MTDFVKLNEDLDISGYDLIEGFPGIGLVAKISADYIIDRLDMEPYAEIYSPDLPKVAIFERDKPELQPAVRIFVDTSRQIAVLKSDAPISTSSREFMEDLIEWINDNNLKPIFQIGLPVDVEEGEHYMFYVESGESQRAENLELNTPPVAGGVTGPTGALIEQALKKDIDALGLVIESDPNFPDPEASQILIEEGITKLTGLEIDTQPLAESADQIKKQKKELIERVKTLRKQKSSEAYPREMYK